MLGRLRLLQLLVFASLPFAGCRKENAAPAVRTKARFLLPQTLMQSSPTAVVRGGFREWDVENEPASLLVELTGVMPWHRTAQGADRVTVLSGMARVQLEDGEHILHAGDALWVPAEQRRRFSRLEGEPAPVLVIESQPSDRPRAVTWLEAGVEP